MFYHFQLHFLLWINLSSSCFNKMLLKVKWTKWNETSSSYVTSALLLNQWGWFHHESNPKPLVTSKWKLNSTSPLWLHRLLWSSIYISTKSNSKVETQQTKPLKLVQRRNAAFLLLTHQVMSHQTTEVAKMDQLVLLFYAIFGTSLSF